MDHRGDHLLGLAGIAAAFQIQSGSGRTFAGALCGLLIVILGVAALTLRVVRGVPLPHPPASTILPAPWPRQPLSARQSIRGRVGCPGHGRDADPDRLSHAARRDWRDEDNLGSQPAQRFSGGYQQQGTARGSSDCWRNSPRSAETWRLLPSVAGRIVSVDGTAARRSKLKNYPRRLLSTVSLTWSKALPTGATMASGEWWDKDDGQSLVVTEHVAERLHLHLGSQIVLVSNGRTIAAKVVAIISTTASTCTRAANLSCRRVRWRGCRWSGTGRCMSTGSGGCDAARALQRVPHGNGNQHRGCA